MATVDQRETNEENEIENDDLSCNEDHSHTGLCPCCGVEVCEVSVDEPCNAYKQYCIDDDCGWCSDVLYDC